MSGFSTISSVTGGFFELPLELIKGFEGLIDAGEEVIISVSDDVRAEVIVVSTNLKDTALGISGDVRQEILGVSEDLKEEVLGVSEDINIEVTTGLKELGKSERQNVRQIANSVNTFIKWETLAWLGTIIVGGLVINNLLTDPELNKTIREGEQAFKATNKEIIQSTREVAKETVKQSGEVVKKALDVIEKNPELVEEVEKIFSGEAELAGVANVLDSVDLPLK